MGARYGLSLHNDKFQLLRIRHEGILKGTDGSIIPSSDSMKYLGCELRADGNIRVEINKKVGQAWSEFNNLNRLWNHTS